MEEKQFSVGEKIEAYSFKARGWYTMTILQLSENHNEVDISIGEERFENVSKAETRTYGNLVHGQWFFPGFGTSSQSISLLEDTELPHNVLEIVDEQHNDAFSTAEDMLVGVSSSIKRKGTKNKSNIWKHCTSLDDPSGEGKQVLKCNYCGHVIKGSGGINLMKQHLAHKIGHKVCLKVPQSVRDQMHSDLESIETRKKSKQG
ncbi:hypothetical protein NE237_000634 [Protea cynaroides]|uniref:BED-type domain-containing protein n=1 Tax=Protea cynaroides TaxID=273540 RepID=A0A9Q0KRJ2_9MAGN|nr:hypothetical protein NE237_000634 [Protea cynaroides]